MSSNPPQAFSSKTPPSAQKLRGAYYTPNKISNFLSNWAIQSVDDRVLEPSCGDGNILVAAAETLLNRGATASQVATNIHAVELERDEAEVAVQRLKELGIGAGETTVERGDFFAYCKEHLSDKRLFDAVIGNPPFIRFQHFAEEHRDPAFDLMAKAGLKASRLTNAWVPFLLASSLLLAETGRLAMVVPAELLQVKYAAGLRQFISDYFERVTLITFRNLVFDEIQQEVVLMLAERTSSSKGIRTIELEDLSDLSSYDHLEVAKSEIKRMNHSTEKWTQYFLHPYEIGLINELREHPKLTRAGEIVDVDVGVVTGHNQFFVLSETEVQRRNLESHVISIVGKSAHIRGIFLEDDDLSANGTKNLASYLFTPADLPFEAQPSAVQDYISEGEEKGVEKGYKCSIRKRWYIVPSVWRPDAFMLRQIHGYPKIVINCTQATSTDTIHRVRMLNGMSAVTVATAFINSLTFAFTEVLGRSYGGGVLEIEPTEAEATPLPLCGAERIDSGEIHRLLLANRADDALSITDKLLLRDGLNLSARDANALRNIWITLRDRRINRKRKQKKAIPA